MRAFRYLRYCLPAAMAAASLSVQAAPAHAGNVPQPTRVLVQQMYKTVENTPTYTLVTSDRVRVKGKLRPRETIAVKQRRSPNCIYAHWIGHLHKGREALYCHGRYNNKVKAHKGGILGFITVTLKPTGHTAMKGELHPISKLNLYHIAQRTRTDMQAAQSGESVTFSSLTRRSVKGQPSSCLTVTHHDNGHRNTICVSQALKVPTSLTVRNAKGQVLGEYTFRKIHLNAGLTDKDFNVNNKHYSF